MVDPTPHPMNHYATRADIDRVETHLKEISGTLGRLLVIDEKQATQAARLDKLDSRYDDLLKKHDMLRDRVNSWINRGLGGWAVILFLFSMFQLYTSVRK